MFYWLQQLSVVDLVGADADKVLNNLTTNHVRALEPSTGCETFITDVRGKTVGHVLAFRSALGFRLIGAPGQSERIAAHIDRYIIREDAVPSVMDANWSGLVLSAPLVAAITGVPVSSLSSRLTGDRALHQRSVELAGHHETMYDTGWLGGADPLILVPNDRSGEVISALEAVGTNETGSAAAALDEAEFHRQRTIAAVPWYGIDLDESNLPQEADRDPLAISFTKGCYLGQETVARLDALGQVQKKLVRWSISGASPAPGSTLSAGDKVVCRLTSVARTEDGRCLAIGMTRRSHFDVGSIAEGTDPATGETFGGTVIAAD